MALPVFTRRALPSAVTVAPIQVAVARKAGVVAACFANATMLRIWRWDGATLVEDTVANQQTGWTPGSISVSPDGNYVLVTRDSASTLCIWKFNGTQWNLVLTLTNVPGSSYNRASAWTNTAGIDEFAVGRGNGTLSYYTFDRNTNIATRRQSISSLGFIDSLTFSGDDAFLITGERWTVTRVYQIARPAMTLTSVFLDTTNGGDWSTKIDPTGKYTIVSRYYSGAGASLLKQDGTSFSLTAPNFRTAAASDAAWVGNLAILAAPGAVLSFHTLDNGTMTTVATPDGLTSLASSTTMVTMDSNPSGLFAYGDSASDFIRIYTATVQNAPITSRGALSLPALTSQGKATTYVGTWGNLRLAAMTSEGQTVSPVGTFGNLTIGRFDATALISAAAEDVIALRPIFMTPGASFVSGVVPSLSIDNDPPPFLYGELGIGAFRTAGTIRFPLEVTNSSLQMARFVSNGKINFPIEASPVELVLAPFSLDGQVHVPNGRFIGDLMLQPFVGDGQVDMPDGSWGTLLMDGFSTNGDIRFGFRVDGMVPLFGFEAEGSAGVNPDITGDLEFGPFAADALLLPPIKTVGELYMLPFTLEARGDKDTRVLEASLEIRSITSEGDIFVPFGMRGDVTMERFRGQGNVQLPLSIKSAVVLPRMNASGLLKRPDAIDANMSMKRLTLNGLVGFDLSNTAQLQMQQITSDGELSLFLNIVGEGALATMVSAGELTFISNASGSLELDAFSTDGELEFTYRINGDGSISPLGLEGLLEMQEPEVGGTLYMRSFDLSGTLRVVMRRRQVRIISDSF